MKPRVTQRIGQLGCCSLNLFSQDFCVYPSFLNGYAHYFLMIKHLLERGQIPFPTALVATAPMGDWRYISHFHDKGGRPEDALVYVLEAIHAQSGLSIGRNTTYLHSAYTGDGDLETTFGDDLDELPVC